MRPAPGAQSRVPVSTASCGSGEGGAGQGGGRGRRAGGWGLSGSQRTKHPTRRPSSTTLDSASHPFWPRKGGSCGHSRARGQAPGVCPPLAVTVPRAPAAPGLRARAPASPSPRLSLPSSASSPAAGASLRKPGRRRGDAPGTKHGSPDEAPPRRAWPRVPPSALASGRGSGTALSPSRSGFAPRAGPMSGPPCSAPWEPAGVGSEDTPREGRLRPRQPRR